jgi:hypothetical protein
MGSGEVRHLRLSPAVLVHLILAFQVLPYRHEIDTKSIYEVHWSVEGHKK